MKVALVSTIFLSIGSQSFFSQEALSLKACIQYGLTSNPSNIIYENQKKIADAEAKQALAGYLPNISGSGSIDDNLKIQDQIIPAGLFGPEDIRIAFTKQYSTNGSIQLNQTIFDQSLIVGLKADQFNKKDAELNKKKNEETIIYNISTAYYQIYIYQLQLDLLEINSQTYQSQLDIVKLKVDKGVSLQKDYDKVLVDFNNNKSQIRVVETNIKLSKNQLKYEMGYSFEKEIEILADDIKSKELSIETDFSDFKVNNLIDYQLDENNLNLLKIDEKKYKAGAFPVLSGYIRYGMNGFGDNLGESFSNLKSFSSIGLKLTVPIFDGFKRKNQVAVAKLNYNNTEATNELNKGKYRLAYENSVSQIEKAESNLHNEQRNIEIAQSVFDVTNLQYQKGVTDMTDWLNSQNSLKTSQNTYLSSAYQLLQSQIELEKSKGTLFQFYESL